MYGIWFHDFHFTNPMHDNTTNKVLICLHGELGIPILVESSKGAPRGEKYTYEVDYSLSSPKKPFCIVTDDATFRCFLRFAFEFFSVGLKC